MNEFYVQIIDGELMVTYPTGVEYGGHREMTGEPLELNTVEALLRMAKTTYPSGWQVIDGKVVEYNPDERLK